MSEGVGLPLEPHELPFAHCMWCGEATAMRALDPWTVPPGVTVSLVVSCTACVEKHRGTKSLADALAWRPTGEEPPRDPREGEISIVFVQRHRGTYYMRAMLGPAVVASSSGWSTRSAAFESGARSINLSGEEP